MKREERARFAKQNMEFNLSRKEFSRANTKTYVFKQLNSENQSNNYKTEVTKEGCVEACVRISNTFNGKIGLLNFASAKHPGGGYLNGARAQEEDICLKSDLYQYIKQETEFYNTATHSKNRGYYKDELLYTKDVNITKREDYTLLDDFINVDIVTCPAPNRSVKSLSFEMAKKGLERRINMIINAFIENECSHLVLGAFGCGVFKNDPELVAELFDMALQKQANNKLKTVIFAIKTNNDKDLNYIAFKNQFNK